ncbi:ATP synthase F1, delta subunit [Coniosporium apollinis CBS 100218]|uniref:ATP synthase subunit 5, mitochondrial n=1 Tax=Coniosporium apollinis (strain CBS 100218) TaxID=1168221 RepID=R7Z1C9_CONA1|nr:ATP synthase F1, delta subunit [Coniosporium apollinis CBS 100218]EON68000.1 ATP synthase F1, delta subunit [Coniosporium apollinis CBS 100218]
MFTGRIVAQAARSAAPRASIAPRAAIRSYAQAANSASTRPPVPLYGVDGTYASALYTAAAKSSALDPTARALDTLNNVFKKDAKLQAVLSAPTLTVDDKKQIVAELQKHIGGADKGDVVKNFLATLAENNRLSILQSVCEKFAVLMGAQRGEVELTVTSAAPLDNKVLRQLENAISKSQYVGQGKKLKVVPKVNPDIRGGLIVEIGDRTIDLSVSSKMARMNKLLKDTL